MPNKKAIGECILLHNALHKRRAYLDTISSGLDVFGVRKMITLFPHVCMPLFVPGGLLEANDVGKIMRPPCPAVVNMTGPHATQSMAIFARISQWSQ